ncbi:SLC13 family permease [Pseudonocardia oroxyli]|uniref:Transporter, UIT1 family n=1 Tax=Pseudonocardia oroxyli TaxID=366584 RepID=A0A1G8DU19_PSEOR|nr:SLC13 family permease [Pseudonocardia oroxyli]SDH61173.1 transporter, UIT1 family [Pseudonocardia oroxyli]
MTTIEIIGVLGLAAVFLLSALRGLNMGVLALVAAFLVGSVLVGSRPKEVLAAFPGDLFVVLLAVTFLFGMARTNGTVDWLVRSTVRLSGNRIGLVPWVLFLLTTVLCAAGAASPAAVAIVAPIGITFAVRHGITPIYAGLMAVNGAAAGSFSPTGILGGIVHGTLAANGLQVDAAALFAGTFALNLVAALATWAIFGRRRIAPAPDEDAAPGAGPAGGGTGRTATLTAAPAASRLQVEQLVTLVGLATLVVGTIGFRLDTGFTALTIAAVLALIFRGTAKEATSQIAWPVILLVCGIVTYIGVLEDVGVVDSLGAMIVGIGTPLVAALVICYIGGVVSAFASTTGILGALVPLSVPFLGSGALPVTGVVIALAAASTIVDASPFSTNGALVIANAPDALRPQTYRAMLLWGLGVCLLAPVAAWLAFVVL